MKQLNHWRNRILALSLCLLFLISALLFLPGNYSARVQAEAPPFAWNDAPVSFTENENDEFSQLTVEIFYFDTATGSYVKLADKAFLAPTGSEISYNPPQIEGFRYEGGFSAITNKLEKGKTTVKLVFIPEGVEADHPNFEVVHVDELPEQPNEPSETP
ncbi:MAG: hypothetical protein Q4P08_02840, partial [Eubacteriales bacterium]|nr:hypothetical protein [Eubacteriales bacterium]